MEKSQSISHDVSAEGETQSVPREGPLDEVQQDTGKRDTREALRRSCQGYISNLSKKYKEIETLMIDTAHTDQVQRKHKQLEGTFLLYERKFTDYCKTLNEDNKDVANQQFESHLANKLEFDARVKEWMNAARGDQPQIEVDDQDQVIEKPTLHHHQPR